MANPEKSADEPAFLSGGGVMVELIARHDWAATVLGPLEAWPAALKVSTSTLLNSSLPMALLVGEDGIALYNEACCALIGLRHPGALGARSRESWPELAGLTDEAITAAQRGERLTFRERELTVLRRGVPEQVWMDIDCSPVRDENGVYLGVMCVCRETTERVLAQRRAAVQLDRIRSVFDQAPGFICLLSGADHIVEYVNEAHKRLFGDRKAEGKSYREAFGDIADEGRLEIVVDVYRSGERYLGRGDPVILPMPGGVLEERFIDVVVEPLKDDTGKVTGIYVEGFDVTPLVHAQHALEENARRLSAAVVVARLGVFELDRETHKATLDDRAREIYGFGRDETLTIEDVYQRIDPEDLRRLGEIYADEAQSAAHIVAERLRREVNYRIRLPDGSSRHIAAVADHVPGASGKIRWVVGVFEDVTERRCAEQRQRLLINELNHRVKNTLATVQSIAAQSLRSASDLPNARASFESRLMALSAAHDLLTAQSWHGARLDEVVASALAPFEAVQRPQISRSGPPVWLTAPRALAFSLALHELATNAAKYGALSVPDGRATVRWSVCGQDLTLFWIEDGGPAVVPPARSGFGTRLLQRSLASDLRGEVELEFAPDGVRCKICCTVEDVRAAAALDMAEERLREARAGGREAAEGRARMPSTAQGPPARPAHGHR